MQTMRETWTDERLDDLNDKVDRGFERMDARFDRVDGKFDRVDERFEALHRLLVQGGVVIIAALIGLIATQL
jgi:ribosome assembly protein YihI (activator of Der GTPase)